MGRGKCYLSRERMDTVLLTDEVRRACGDRPTSPPVPDSSSVGRLQPIRNCGWDLDSGPVGLSLIEMGHGQW